MKRASRIIWVLWQAFYVVLVEREPALGKNVYIMPVYPINSAFLTQHEKKQFLLI